MDIKSSESRVVERHFEDEDVWVTVPTQVEARPLSIVQLDMPDPNTMPATPGVFDPLRLVINFAVKEEDDNHVDRFIPPMVLRVAITEADLELVGQGHELKLAFWDGSKWVPFTQKKHQFEFDRESKYAIAVIRHWGDPPVGVGR